MSLAPRLLLRKAVAAERVATATSSWRRIRVAPLSASSSSDDDDLVLTAIDSATGVATVTLNRPPVNSLSLEMFQAISCAIQAVEADSSVQAMVLKSSNPAVFSAGLDLREMHQPDMTRLREYWTAFQQVYIDLYGSRLACIAAIQGSAPAAGCMLALSCDYRIMAASSSSSDGATGGKPPTIGLNESKLGIAAPPFLARQFIDTVGKRQAELGLSLGTLYSPEQAKSIGLVDQLVPADQVLDAAQQAAAQQWAKIPPAARVKSKMLVRREPIEHLQENRQGDVDDFVSFITSDAAQNGLSAYLQAMAQKSKKK